MDLPTIVKRIEQLITPCKECKSLEDAFEQAIKAYSGELEFVRSFKEENHLPSCSSLELQSWWKYVSCLLDLLLNLQNFLKTASGTDCLISTKQKKILESSIQILVSLGVLSNLSPGYGVSKEKKSSSFQLLDIETSTQAKTYSVGFVVRGILVLSKEETLEEIVTRNHFGDVLASLFHVLLVEKPEESQFGEERGHFKRDLSRLLEECHQPLVIRELMILHGNQECPPKLSRILKKFLTDRLMSDGGIVATIRAITDVAGDSTSPRYWATVMAIAKLIVTPHANDSEEYFLNVRKQMWPLLFSNEKDLVHAAVMCLKLLHERDPSICHKYFLCEAFKIFSQPSSEDDVNECLRLLGILFGSPSNFSRIDLRALVPHSTYLFRMYFSVHKSPFLLKKEVENLLWCCVNGVEDLKGWFEDLFFNENEDPSIHYEFGDGGGIVGVTKKKVYSCEKTSECFLDFFMQRSDGGQKVALFNSLVLVIVESKATPERTFVVSEILSVLCTDIQVLEAVLESPSTIILLLKTLIEEKKCVDTMSSLLMAMTLILGDCSREKDWGEFASLLEPLKKLKDSDSGDIGILADEVYSLILTHGIGVESSLPKEKRINIEIPSGEPQTPCQKALVQAGDSLLPVRGHALRELAKLILRGDKETLAKKEIMLGVFQENLKNDDSYIYLSAIEGLASLASVLTDRVLQSIVEEYTHCKCPELRLKIGEVLLRTTRNIGEMVSKYKSELIICFLRGVNDEDHIVRASSLSNLGEVCKLLKFNLGTLIIEIFDCIRCIAKSDKAPEPRRAAVMVVSLLFEGLGPSALSVLEPVIVEIYGTLKFIHENDKDEMVRLHAQVALDQLGSSTLTYLFPKPERTKKIVVLDPPI